MNEEYEYSFKVKDIKPFVNYCESNNYDLVNEYEQIRTLYKNGGKVMARITKNTYQDNISEILNFKDDNISDSDLKVSRESKDLIITDDNREFIDSLINILDLNNKKELIRKRFVYKKQNVTFEIDDYTKPLMKVIAIEGNRKEVDSVYNCLKEIIDTNKVD